MPMSATSVELDQPPRNPRQSHPALELGELVPENVHPFRVLIYSGFSIDLKIATHCHRSGNRRSVHRPDDSRKDPGRCPVVRDSRIRISVVALALSAVSHIKPKRSAGYERQVDAGTHFVIIAVASP